MNSRLHYFLKCLIKYMLRQGRHCPSCGSRRYSVVDRKYFITALYRCIDCMLQYRVPTDNLAENERYYQEDYTEGFGTQIPSLSELEYMKANKFSNSPFNYNEPLKIFKALTVTPNNTLILDYGCSWGYGSWQLKSAGYNVLGFEISKPRADFARKYLDIEMAAPLTYKSKIDIFFMHHVLEHVPSASTILNLALSIVKPSGYIVSFTPNGSQHYRRIAPRNWSSSWGMKHPNHIDELFYSSFFSDRIMYISSSPYNITEICEWKANPKTVINRLDGKELLVVVRI